MTHCTCPVDDKAVYDPQCPIHGSDQRVDRTEERQRPIFEDLPTRDARLDRERSDRIEAAHAAVEPECEPLEKFRRVWEGDSNSGTVKLKGS